MNPLFLVVDDEPDVEVGARGLHDRDILLIGGDQHADDQLRAGAGQMARQHVDHRRSEGAAPLIVALADDQEVVAPVHRPHPIGIEISELLGKRAAACPRLAPVRESRECRPVPGQGPSSRSRTRTRRQQRTPFHT